MTATFVGMPAFPTAARAALADTQLRRNLAHATSTIRAKRLNVVGEVPEWEELRLAGAAIKDQALLDLDQHLLRLEETLTANGAIVHWARDAAEACAIVAGVAREHDVDEVVKVKSMATAEIELNERLAEQGIAAWETDLAELIVQLGDDLPSHILVPAIHRNRAEIREIFLSRMAGAGKPAPADLTDEPSELAAAARQHLREKFLRAKVGISGANFAVADTGTLVVVESEGNGRMCLTLPEVLVSVVGIEKVVPTWGDLDVFLQTLPRSSTGERMNPYTSTWSGVTPGDGPQEVHVVLVDNGRTRALADEVGRQALRCIRCSACLNVCPVYERTGGHAYGSVYPGPIGAILNPLLRGPGSSEQVDSLPYASTLCGACFEACPVRIDIPSVLVDLRTQVVDAHRGGVPSAQAVAMKGAAWTFGRSGRLRGAERVSGLVGDVVRRFGRRSLPGGRSALGRLPGPGGAWTGARDLPTPPAESFRAWWRRTGGGTSEVGTDRRAGRAGHAPAHARDRHHDGGPAVSARDDILARVRTALSTRPAGEVEVPRGYRSVPPPATGEALVDLFVERVEDYRATVRRCTASELPAAIESAVGGRRVVVPAELPWQVSGAVVDADQSAPELDEIEVVVTAAALGVAVTGTIVLDHRGDQGRRALSLVPDHHVCVVRAGQVVGTVPEAVAALDPARPLTWISGPSATSDIELNRVEGVHGPRVLEVLLVTDA